MPNLSVRIYETEAFKNDVSKYMTDVELAAMRTYVASNPTIGDAIDVLPELNVLEWQGSNTVDIVYTVSDDFDHITLVAIFPKDGPLEFDDKDKEEVSKLLSVMKKLGIAAAIRGVWEFIKDLS